MKFQLIECNKINIFLQKLCRKWIRETSSRLLFLLFFKKALYEVKTSGLQTTFNIFRLFQYISNFRLLIQRYAQFCFFRKSCHILYMIFQEKCFSCYTLQLTKWLLYKWTNFFVRLSYFLRYWAICVLQLFVPQVLMS